MPLFGRRKRKDGGERRSFAADAAAMRSALSARQAEIGVRDPVDLRSAVRDLLEGELAAPTADVATLIRSGADPDDFYARELAPSWDGLAEPQRAARLDGFLDLSRMLEDPSAGAMAQEMGPTVRTKTLVLAWAFDETYGYLPRLAREEGGAEN